MGLPMGGVSTLLMGMFALIVWAAITIKQAFMMMLAVHLGISPP